LPIYILEALQGVIGARAIATTINIRLTKQEIDYILTHSGAKLIFVDHEYEHLISNAKARRIVCNDTGRTGDPYEDFLTAGRAFSQEKGWAGLEMDADENKALSLNYTYVLRLINPPWFFDPSRRSGTTGRVSYP
jgi:long-subunit acyl-CoA synthetase (AMP-forming)